MTAGEHELIVRIYADTSAFETAIRDISAVIGQTNDETRRALVKLAEYAAHLPDKSAEMSRMRAAYRAKARRRNRR